MQGHGLGGSFLYPAGNRCLLASAQVGGVAKLATGSGLSMDSPIMTNNLATIHDSEIDRVIGTLTELKEIDVALRTTLSRIVKTRGTIRIFGTPIRFAQYGDRLRCHAAQRRGLGTAKPSPYCANLSQGREGDVPAQSSFLWNRTALSPSTVTP